MKVYGWNSCVTPPIHSRHCMELSGQLYAPIYTRGRNLRSWVRPRDGADVLEEIRFSCSCQLSTGRLLLYPRYSTIVCRTDRSTASYSPCSASSRSCNVFPAPAPSHFLLHPLLTFKLTTTPADPYDDREASCTYCWSVRRQFSPSASPFMSYRLDPVISVNISVSFFRLSQKAFGLTWRFVSLSTSICNWQWKGNLPAFSCCLLIPTGPKRRLLLVRVLALFEGDQGVESRTTRALYCSPDADTLRGSAL